MSLEKSPVAVRLKNHLQGEVRFDAWSRGLYSTDASIYQIEPLGVVIPQSIDDVVATVQIAAEAEMPLLPRGAGTSQNGQTVGKALVMDFSKYLHQVGPLDLENRTISVQPGVVLEQLNQFLKPQGLFFPVDVSTANRATLGGMAGNNSCGARSLRYGNMLHNVHAIEGLMANGQRHRFGPVSAGLEELHPTPRYRQLVQQLCALAQREKEELEHRFPKLLRRVGGYNLDSLCKDNPNMAHLLVGSEGTLSTFTNIELRLQPIPQHKVLAVCHFPTFYQAMEATQHIVRLQPSAVELIDGTMIELSRNIPLYQATVQRFVQGQPEAILLVEFAGDALAPQLQHLQNLQELMGDLGFPKSVVEAIEPDFQAEIWEVRKGGLNIMMSMKGAGKPVSFIEDCAVPLADLAEYTRRLTHVFEKHGTTGTWYAHASVGCLHVRPILNMKEAQGAKKMRAIAEEALALVREYKGSHSGEHGDGISRSEFHPKMFGERLQHAFEEVKTLFDPKGLLNPGKIVHAPKMDDRWLFRYKPDYRPEPLQTALDWSAWQGFAGAVEMCNNNGACRKFDSGAMCPSYRASGEEKHLTRGRANALRLALTGQLGKAAFVSKEMYETLDLCVSCKACKRECPTGVDMARMKIEFLHHYRRRHGLPLKERMLAFLPRYAPLAAGLAPLANLRNTLPGMAWLGEKMLGVSQQRSLPRWRRDYFHKKTPPSAPRKKEVVLWVDTFNTWFEPENAWAAHRVLEAAGYPVHVPQPPDAGRPLCCGRTFLAAGLVAEAQKEAQRTIEALEPFVQQGIPIVGLEPACLLTFRDEFQAIWPSQKTDMLAQQAFLLEEFLVHEHENGRLQLSLNPLPYQKALLHGHCHQKAFNLMGSVEQVLAWIPNLDVAVVPASCCGMAGAFGYDARHYEFSMKMGELSLLPAVRATDKDCLIVADGTSCRQQIADGAQRVALHSARVLEMGLRKGC